MSRTRTTCEREGRRRREEPGSQAPSAPGEDVGPGLPSIAPGMRGLTRGLIMATITQPDSMPFGDGLPDRRLSGQYDLYASQVRLGTGSRGERGAGGRSDHAPEHLAHASDQLGGGRCRHHTHRLGREATQIVGIPNPWAQHEGPTGGERLRRDERRRVLAARRHDDTGRRERVHEASTFQVSQVVNPLQAPSCVRDRRPQLPIAHDHDALKVLQQSGQSLEQHVDSLAL